MQANNLQPNTFLRQSQIVGVIVPISAPTLWRWVREGTFPKPVKLSGKVTAWRSDEVLAWIERQSAAGAKAAA